MARRAARPAAAQSEPSLGVYSGSLESIEADTMGAWQPTEAPEAERVRPRRTAPTNSSSPSRRRPPRATGGAGALSQSGLATAPTNEGAARQPREAEHGIVGLAPGKPAARDFSAENAKHARGRPTSAPVFRTVRDLVDRSNTLQQDDAIRKTVAASKKQRPSSAHPRSEGRGRVGMEGLIEQSSAPTLGSASLTGRSLGRTELGHLERGAHLSPSKPRPRSVVVVLERHPTAGYGLDLRVGTLASGEFTLSGSRLLVARVRAGTPAAAAGLQPLDEIVGAAMLAEGREVEVEIGPTLPDAGLTELRSACARPRRMRWSLSRLPAPKLAPVQQADSPESAPPSE